MEDPALDEPMTRRDLLRLRTLVLGDSVALHKWNLLTDFLVSNPADALHIQSKIDKYDLSGAVLQTFEIWQAERPGQATVSTFCGLLKKHNLNQLAERVQVEFTTPESAPNRSVFTSHDGPSSSSSVVDTQAQKPRAARAGRVAVPGTDLKSRITSALPDIISNVGNLSQLLAILVSENTITVHDLELVQSKPSTSDQLSTLTLLFARKPPAAWERFKEALMDTGNEHVAGRI